MTARTARFADRVSVTIDDHVAHVLLDRPEKMNALDPAMFDGLIAAGQSLLDARDVRCVVLSGAGKAFCAGLDLAAMGALASAEATPLTTRTHGACNAVQYAAMIWRRLPMPVIGAIHGICFGGGLQIACGPEIRVAAPDARLAVMESKWGLVPDMGGYALWRGTVREDHLRELTYTHREFSGEEAAELGFVTHVDANPVQRALALAQDIAAKSPHAIRAAKAIFARFNESSAEDLLTAESHHQHELLGSRNQLEAVAAGMARRKADFVDP